MCTSQSTNFLLQKEKVLLIFLLTTSPYLITNWCDPFQLSLAVEVHIIDMVLLNTLLYVQCVAKVCTHSIFAKLIPSTTLSYLLWSAII